ncbi:MAG: magnesium/cobalt transporter CorA [Pseudomonadales bacterium]
MISAYLNEQDRLLSTRGDPAQLDGVVWIDLMEPTPDEESALEKALGIAIPTREEMDEIEVSSRLYTEDGAVFMTATLPSRTESEHPIISPVTFVLTQHRLVTIRYSEPRAFRTMPTRASKVALGCQDGEGVLLALLEAQIDRMADILERAGRDIAGLSAMVFRNRGRRNRREANLQTILEQIGAQGDLNSNVRECLMSLDRVLGYLSQAIQPLRQEKEVRNRIKTMSRDLHSLVDHTDSLTQKATFLLDATLGLINIEQNGIIKFFSVAAVVFLPPTLIASIYGMNFQFMPELHWPVGYPLAILLMVISAVLPYLLFKRRGWL